MFDLFEKGGRVERKMISFVISLEGEKRREKVGDGWGPGEDSGRMDGWMGGWRG